VNVNRRTTDIGFQNTPFSLSSSFARL